MKNVALSLLIALSLFSCRKANDILLPQTKNNQIADVRTFLQDSLTSVNISDVDFDHAIRSVIDSGRINFIRLPFKGVGMKNAFILINTDTKGNCLSGVIVDISTNSDQSTGEFNGILTIRSLKNKKIGSHIIEDGYIRNKAENNGVNFVITEDPNTLPDVIVVAYIPSDGSEISWLEWMNLVDVYGSTGYDVYGSSGTTGSEGGYGYYSPSDPFEYPTQYSEDNDTPPADDGIPIDDTKIIGYEYPESLEAISIDAYMKCFSTIADAGSTCSIEIFSDLPVNGEPNTFFNWTTGSPGHTFLQIKKSNGTASVQQNIGFYPDQGWKTMLTPAPVTGKFVDNAGHEFNASMKMMLTPEQLQSVIDEMLYLENSIKYDIDENNCTDFALRIFNVARPGNPVVIPKYDIPGGMAPYGTSTPQGLYQQLSAMKAEGGSEAANITLPGLFGWVGDSHGPCY